MVPRPGKPVPLSAAEAEAGKCPCGRLPLLLLHHVQLPFHKGREGISKLSLFFSKVRTGLGKESTPFHHGPLFVPWERRAKCQGYWFQPLEEQPRSTGQRPSYGLGQPPPLFTPTGTSQAGAGQPRLRAEDGQIRDGWLYNRCMASIRTAWLLPRDFNDPGGMVLGRLKLKALESDSLGLNATSSAC